MINKGRAALVAVVFFALVRPDEVPAMWIVSFLTLLLYESVLMGLNIWTQARAEKKQQKQEQETYYHNRANGRRWKNETMAWQMREVSNK